MAAAVELTEQLKVVAHAIRNGLGHFVLGKNLTGYGVVVVVSHIKYLH